MKKNTESFLILILFLVLFFELFQPVFASVIILKIALLLISIIIVLYMIHISFKEQSYKNEVKILKKKIIYINKKLQKLDDTKSEFISIASHQLRTPLTASKGYISLILEGTYGNISDEVKNILNNVYISNEHLIQLVEDLLNVSRIESGKMNYNFKEVNIYDIVSGLEDTFMLMAKKRGIEFKINKSSDEKINVFVDSFKIKEVISNLIDNAIKYTEKGFVNVTIEHNDDIVKIIVKDSGIGMSKKSQEHLFSKFSRGKESAHIYTEGVGLGLFVGKHIAQAHNGTIIASSEGFGKGSCFILQLPIIK